MLSHMAPQTVDRIRSKVASAHRLIEDFTRHARVFFETNPCTVGIRRDPDEPKRVFYVASLLPIPDALTSITANALQDLRSPLDYIATQIETAACGTKPKHRIYFPIGRDAAHYERVRRAYIRCAGQRALDAFDATEPYKGGNGHTIWQLHELNKPDKHEWPLATYGGYAALDLAPTLNDTWPFPDHTVTVPPLWFHPQDRLCPLEVGDALYVEPWELEMKQDRQFRFDISFHEPGVIECEPVLVTLQNLANVVDGIITAFEPLLPPDLPHATNRAIEHPFQ